MQDENNKEVKFTIDNPSSPPITESLIYLVKTKGGDGDEGYRDIVFTVGGTNEVLKLEAGGDIYVHGKLVENDKQVVDALRKFLTVSTVSDKKDDKLIATVAEFLLDHGLDPAGPEEAGSEYVAEEVIKIVRNHGKVQE